ncbi:MAG: plasmid mobilization relaxosome protein MobC [Clostridia bacterium]|nr:plasmid mobilization relaxosome protein MobC [Clostridia bacterium]
MRKRFIRIDVMLNEEEHQKLMDNVSKVGTSYSDYIRKLIMDTELKEKPDYEFYSVMKELTKIGTNLNQLAKKANSLNFIDRNEYERQAEEWKNFSNEIKRKYL